MKSTSIDEARKECSIDLGCIGFYDTCELEKYYRSCRKTDKMVKSICKTNFYKKIL